MAGVPSFISDGPWLGLFLFLLVVVFFRAQGTYWLGRWVRRRADTASQSSPDSRGARWVRRFSGPSMDKWRVALFGTGSPATWYRYSV